MSVVSSNPLHDEVERLLERTSSLLSTPGSGRQLSPRTTLLRSVSRASRVAQSAVGEYERPNSRLLKTQSIKSVRSAVHFSRPAETSPKLQKLPSGLQVEGLVVDEDDGNSGFTVQADGEMPAILDRSVSFKSTRDDPYNSFAGLEEIVSTITENKNVSPERRELRPAVKSPSGRSDGPRAERRVAVGSASVVNDIAAGRVSPGTRNVQQLLRHEFLYTQDYNRLRRELGSTFNATAIVARAAAQVHESTDKAISSLQQLVGKVDKDLREKNLPIAKIDSLYQNKITRLRRQHQDALETTAKLCAPTPW